MGNAPSLVRAQLGGLRKRIAEVLETSVPNESAERDRYEAFLVQFNDRLTRLLDREVGSQARVLNDKK